MERAEDPLRGVGAPLLVGQVKAKLKLPKHRGRAGVIMAKIGHNGIKGPRDNSVDPRGSAG